MNVPSKFRAAFADGVVLVRWLEPCVALWTADGFDAFTDSLFGRLNPVSEERRKMTRFFAGGSFDVELDSAGRVTFNQTLMTHAGLGKDAVVVGVLDHLEVWDRERWLADQDELGADVAEIARGLGHPA